jgi:hypothetical protein
VIVVRASFSSVGERERERDRPMSAPMAREGLETGPGGGGGGQVLEVPGAGKGANKSWYKRLSVAL